MIAADHVAVIVLKVADTASDAVVADGRVSTGRCGRHNHFLDTGCSRRHRVLKPAARRQPSGRGSRQR